MSAGSRAGAPPFALDASGLALGASEPLPPEQVLEGAPATAERALWASPDGAVESGIWEITPGVGTDVEAPEVFLVLSGRATVEIEDGSTLELSPGVVGSFAGGERTVWRVRETLRKLYTVSLG
ncbi:MAG TPA: cupin domain-containing protein [Solirubrobacteraceae bacterium]|nr:cupin domain-containing protein [Solirubrobacteraceae bacterium]